MKPEETQLLIGLLTERQVASVAVLVDGAPYIGLMPFAVRPDFSALLVHVSTLAKHSKGMADGQPFSLLIHTPEMPGMDALQTPRATLQGQVALLPKTLDNAPNPAYAAARAIYQEKFPQSVQTFALGDFNLYELIIEHGRFVAGFAAAYNLSPSSLKALRR